MYLLISHFASHYKCLLPGRRMEFTVTAYRACSDEKGAKVIIMKANEVHFFSNLVDKVLYMFRTGPLSIIRSISTLYTRNRYL